LAWNQDNVFE